MGTHPTQGPTTGCPVNCTLSHFDSSFGGLGTGFWNRYWVTSRGEKNPKELLRVVRVEKATMARTGLCQSKLCGMTICDRAKELGGQRSKQSRNAERKTGLLKARPRGCLCYWQHRIFGFCESLLHSGYRLWPPKRSLLPYHNPLLPQVGLHGLCSLQSVTMSRYCYLHSED